MQAHVCDANSRPSHPLLALHDGMSPCHSPVQANKHPSDCPFGNQCRCPFLHKIWVSKFPPPEPMVVRSHCLFQWQGTNKRVHMTKKPPCTGPEWLSSGGPISHFHSERRRLALGSPRETAPGGKAVEERTLEGSSVKQVPHPPPFPPHLPPGLENLFREPENVHFQRKMLGFCL